MCEDKGARPHEIMIYFRFNHSSENELAGSEQKSKTESYSNGFFDLFFLLYTYRTI